MQTQTFAYAHLGRSERRPYEEKATAKATATEISNFRFEISYWGNRNGESNFKNPTRKYGVPLGVGTRKDKTKCKCSPSPLKGIRDDSATAAPCY